MIQVRRAKERRHARRGKREVWLTFYRGDPTGPLLSGLGALESIHEERLPPRADARRLPSHTAEVVTYVRDGSFSYRDSRGRSGVIHAGEFQRLTKARGIRHSETNASRTHWAHVFRIFLRPAAAGLEPVHEQKRFSAAERRGALCIIASPDARRGSLLVQDALIYSAMLDPGQHVIHELSPTRSAWLHVVEGEVTVGDLVLTTGDGLGVIAERAVSLTAREETEVLLVDLGASLPRQAGNGEIR